MRGKELFEKYTERNDGGSAADTYAQALMTMWQHIGDDLFPLLEQAESENKKLDFKDPKDENLDIDTILLSDIILVNKTIKKF